MAKLEAKTIRANIYMHRMLRLGKATDERQTRMSFANRHITEV